MVIHYSAHHIGAACTLDFHLHIVAFSVAGIGKKDPAETILDQIVGAVELLALELVCQDDDVSFIIDTMFLRNNDPDDDFFGAINETSVGVTGHSMGGLTAMISASGWDGQAGDERVTAIAPISGAFTGNLTDEQIEFSRDQAIIGPTDKYRPYITTVK